MTVLICFIAWQQLWEIDNHLSPPKHTAETDHRPKPVTGWFTSGGPADARKTDTVRKRWSLIWEQRETPVSLFSKQMNKKCKYTLILYPQNVCWHSQNQISPSPKNHPENTCPSLACHPSYKPIFSSWLRNDGFLGFLPSLPDLMQKLPGLDPNSGRSGLIITWCTPGSRKLFQGTPASVTLT